MGPYWKKIIPVFSSVTMKCFEMRQGWTVQRFTKSTFLWHLVRFMVLNATFNNISVILCWSVILVEEAWVPGENHRSVASHWQTLSHNVVSSTPRLSRVRTLNISGDRHWLHRQLEIQLPYDHQIPTIAENSLTHEICIENSFLLNKPQS
jgi:hypothetical protein